MSLLLRGITWFGLYLLLAVMPLVAAAWLDPVDAPRPATLEAGVALGFLAFALVIVQFALVSRIAGSSRPFGADALMQFHRQMGLVALAFAFAHPWLAGAPLAAWNPFSGSIAMRSGALALLLIVALVATSVWRRALRLSYEAWQVTHLVASLAVVALMLVHVLGAGGYARHASMRSLVVGYAAAFLALTFRYRVVRPLLIWRHPWQVVENRDEGASTRTIAVAPLRHAGCSFEPGQFAWLITGRTPLWSQQHPVSIASSAERPQALEFAIKALGDWSSDVVPSLAPGRRVWIDGPFGAFTPDRVAAQGLVLIAGGIGIAPMRSILETMKDRGDRRHVLLVYAAHDETRLPFKRALEALPSSLNLDIVWVLESPPAGWQCETGFVTRELLARHLPPHHKHYQFFVCGPAPMMDALERELQALGIDAGRIQTERFDMV